MVISLLTVKKIHCSNGESICTTRSYLPDIDGIAASVIQVLSIFLYVSLEVSGSSFTALRYMFSIMFIKLFLSGLQTVALNSISGITIDIKWSKDFFIKLYKRHSYYTSLEFASFIFSSICLLHSVYMSICSLKAICRSSIVVTADILPLPILRQALPMLFLFDNKVKT